MLRPQLRRDRRVQPDGRVRHHDAGLPEVNEVSAESGAVSVIRLLQRYNLVNEVSAGSPHFFCVFFLHTLDRVRQEDGPGGYI
eukprot:SAG22_NODE_10905_length_510_cov_3.328467_1_plen_83_part_00